MKTWFYKLFYRPVTRRDWEPKWKRPEIKGYTEGAKRFRLDVNLWEQKRTLFFISWYVYSIWERGRLRTFWKFRRRKGGVYFHFKPLAPIIYTEAEAREKFGANKYLWPANFKYVA